MNKKEARRRKHEADKKKRRDILDSPIIGAEDEEFEGEEIAAEQEEEETLLGNLARVENIPVMPWRFPIPVFPLGRQTLNMPPSKGDDPIIEVFRETSEKEHDLIGFLPLVFSGADNDMEQMMRAMSAQRIGMAAQVREVKTTEVGTHLIELWGICRFEILDVAGVNKNFVEFNVRWFEDDEEPDEILRPLHAEFNEIIKRIAKMRGESLRWYQDTANFPPYENHAVQYSSFMFLDSRKFDWFTLEEQVELLNLTQTSERMRRVLKRAKMKLPTLDKKWTIERRTKNN